MSSTCGDYRGTGRAWPLIGFDEASGALRSLFKVHRMTPDADELVSKILLKRETPKWDGPGWTPGTQNHCAHCGIHFRPGEGLEMIAKGTWFGSRVGDPHGVQTVHSEHSQASRPVGLIARQLEICEVCGKPFQVGQALVIIISGTWLTTGSARSNQYGSKFRPLGRARVLHTVCPEN